MWLEKAPQNQEYTVYFECKVVETQTVVIGSGAYAKLHNIAQKNNQKPAENASVVEKSAGNTSKFACEQIFTELELKMKKNPDIGKSINKNYAFRIKKNDETKLFSKFLKIYSSFNLKKRFFKFLK